jgi:hypothetical protein
MKRHEKIAATFSDFFSVVGFSLSKSAELGMTRRALDLIRPTVNLPMIRLGGSEDGSYALPDDLCGITHCFSPGVGPSSAFELDVAKLGMQVFMADASVARPAARHPNFHFQNDYVASYSDTENHLVSMDDWVGVNLIEAEAGDLLLQMDIEGAEYEVIHSMSEEILQKFRIVVIEFHHLNQLRHGIMCGYMKSAFEKLLKHFNVCHAENNLAAGTFKAGYSRYSRLCEVSFIRKDRC